MIDPLVDQVEGVRSLVFLSNAAIEGAEMIADRLAELLVQQSHEIELAKKRHAENKARLAVLEAALASSQKQEPISKAFHSLTLRARGLNMPAQSYNEVARA